MSEHTNKGVGLKTLSSFLVPLIIFILIYSSASFYSIVFFYSFFVSSYFLNNCYGTVPSLPSSTTSLLRSLNSSLLLWRLPCLPSFPPPSPPPLSYPCYSIFSVLIGDFYGGVSAFFPWVLFHLLICIPLYSYGGFLLSLISFSSSSFFLRLISFLSTFWRFVQG